MQGETGGVSNDDVTTRQMEGQQTIIRSKENSKANERQEKIFTNWANFILKKRGLRISSVLTDLEDGLILIQLTEILSGKPVPTYEKNPRVIPQKLSNLSIVLKIFQQEGVRIGAIGPKAIASGDPKSILGLLWQLILHYQLGSLGMSRPPNEELSPMTIPRSAAESDLEVLEHELARLNQESTPAADASQPPLRDHTPTAPRQAVGTLFRTKASSPETAGILCLKCGKHLATGTVVMVDFEARYHLDCFVCVVCHKQFEDSYWEIEGKPYCADHYAQQAGQRCEKCHEYILDKVVKAMDATWHFECFVCASCRKPFDENYYTFEGRPYCKQDYNRKKGWLCGKCDKLVQSGDKSALGKAWHRKCFVCTECDQAFDDEGFFGWNGYPYCPKHYHEKKAQAGS